MFLPVGSRLFFSHIRTKTFYLGVHGYANSKQLTFLQCLQCRFLKHSKQSYFKKNFTGGTVFNHVKGKKNHIFKQNKGRISSQVSNHYGSVEPSLQQIMSARSQSDVGYELTLSFKGSAGQRWQIYNLYQKTNQNQDMIHVMIEVPGVQRNSLRKEKLVFSGWEVLEDVPELRYMSSVLKNN